MVPTIIVMTIVEDINMLKKGDSYVRRYHFDFEKNLIFVNGKPVGSRYKFYDIHKIREEYNKIFNDFEMKDYRVYTIQQ